MDLIKKLKAKLARKLVRKSQPEHLRRGAAGERAAEIHLKAQGLKFLARNFRGAHGEMDLVFRDGDCLKYLPVHMNLVII